MKVNYENEDTIAEIAFLASLIQDKKRGRYEATDIIKGYEQYFDDNVGLGMRLRTYVRDEKLENIVAHHIDVGSKHWFYDLHGGPVAID